MRPDDVAAAVVESMRTALAPVHERLDAIETRMAERMAAAATASELTIAKELTPIRERLAAIETRPPQAGPPGDPGPAGRDGKDGEPGRPGMQYRGVYAPGTAYDLGDVVTYAGSSWHCNAATDTRPGEGVTSWQLMVKRGRDGRGA